MAPEAPLSNTQSQVQGSNLRGVARSAAVIAVGAASFLALAGPAAGVQPLKASGSAKQVLVTGASPGQSVKLKRDGKTVATKHAGELGGVVFRRVDPGKGYTVKAGGTKTKSVRVFGNGATPASTKTYDQTLPAGGYGYLKTRDGTKLAIDVHLPGPAEDGPYPTVIEYSGYGYANPAGPQSGIQPVASLLGLAVVDINMRGTGCSGGAFDYFERQQALDGYDAVETVANQPWALHHKAGMMGISYGGISQLFVAATRPPSLSAITPLSVIDNTITTLYPGGILNTGFAFEWAQDRVDDSQPSSPTTGQGWAWDQIEGGDSICKRNQELHPEAVNLLDKVRANRHYHPRVADPLAPVKFVDKIDVPVFMACQWTDEQTGGHCPTLPAQFTGTKKKWFTFTNGTHIDSLDPATFNRWYDFMQLYIAKRKPDLPDNVKALAPTLYGAIMGVSRRDPARRPDPGPAQLPSSEEGLREAANGAHRLRQRRRPGPGQPLRRLQQELRQLPRAGHEGQVSSTSATTASSAGARTNGAADELHLEPRCPPAHRLHRQHRLGQPLDRLPDLRLGAEPAGQRAHLHELAPRLRHAVVGGGEVEVWVRSQAKNVDLQATISEIRPDDQETFVQSGWLRTESRKMFKSSTADVSGADLAQARREDAAEGQARSRCGSRSTTRGICLSRGLADQGLDLGAGRRPADLGVRGDQA